MSTTLESSTSIKFSLLNSFPNEPGDSGDLSFFDQRIDQLNDYDAADCLFRAALVGNEMLMRRIVERRGPTPVVFVNEHPAKSFKLNGERLNGMSIPTLGGVHTPAALKSLIKTIDELGMKGLIDHGPTFPALFRKLNINSDYKLMKTVRFDGDLPSLTEPQLVNPELAIVLADESANTCTPLAYKPILCWASEAMIKEYPHSLAPFETIQEVSGHGPMAQWKAEVNESGNLQVGTIATGLKASPDAKFALQLSKTLAPLSQVFGFDDLQGRVLCETTTEFLLSFPMDSVSKSKINTAKTFVENYCPLDIMAIQASEACINLHAPMTFKGDLVSFHQAPYNELFGLLAKEHPLRDRALGMMEPVQWKALFEKESDNKLIASSLIAMHQAFGVDNEGIQVVIRYDDIPALKAAKYRFSDKTKFFGDEKSFKSHNSGHRGQGTTSVYAFMNASLLFNPDDYPEGVPVSRQLLLDRYTEHFIDLANLGIWPSNSAPPSDFAEAVKMAGSADLSDSTNNRSMALRGILVCAGIEACVQAISAPKQWLKLAELFPRSAFDPYMKTMPTKAKGLLLEQEMGL
jgi:hypothetical protein